MHSAHLQSSDTFDRNCTRNIWIWSIWSAFFART